VYKIGICLIKQIIQNPDFNRQFEENKIQIFKSQILKESFKINIQKETMEKSLEKYYENETHDALSVFLKC